MNKYQDALNDMCGYNAACCKGDNNVDIIQELIDKEFPQKGIDKPWGFGDLRLCCPKCGQPIINVWNIQKYTPNYCHYCGQHFAWEDKTE